MKNRWWLLAGLQWLLATAATVWAAEPVKQLPQVEATSPANPTMVELNKWAGEVEQALAKGVMKEHDQLTAHDRKQILILQQDLAQLRKSLRVLEMLSRKARFRRTLSQYEISQLAQNYAIVEGVLENVPDAFMPQCKLVHNREQRNRVTVCVPNLQAIEAFRRSQHGNAPDAFTGKVRASDSRVVQPSHEHEGGHQ